MAAEPEVKPEVKPPEVKPPEVKPEPDEGFKEIKAQRDDLKAQRRAEAAELTQLRAFKAEQDKAAAALEEQKLKEKGNYEQIIANKTKESDAKQTALINKMALTAIPLLIKSAAAKIPNLAEGALEDLPDLLDKHLVFDADNISVRVINPNGTPMLDPKTGKEIDPDTFIQGFIKDRPRMLTDALPVRHGLIPPNKTSGKTSIFEMSQEETQAVIGTEIDASGNPRIVDAAAAAAYNDALAAEFTQGRVVQRARAQLQSVGIISNRGGAAK